MFGVWRFLLTLVWGSIFCSSLFAATADKGEAQDKWIIVHAGELLAIPGQEALKQQSVIIKNGRIERVEAGFSAAETLGKDATDIQVLDLRNKFVLPGLIDAHTHLSMSVQSGEGQTHNPQLMAAVISEADLTLNAVLNARKTLAAGFTTVRNVGSRSDAVLALRDAIRNGKLKGPRIQASAGFVSITSGHGDLEGMREDVIKLLQGENICDGAAECRKITRTQIRKGADVIKIMATGGGGEDNGYPDAAPEMFDDELRAVVDSAHALDRKVTAHAHGTQGIIAALKAGVDSIEHGSFLNDEAIRLFKRHNAYLVPTMSVLNKLESIKDKAPPHLLPRIEPHLKYLERNVAKAYKKGVKIALGTDAGIVPHGQNARELERYIRIGMSPMDAIVTGTVNAAELMGLSSEIGTLEPGKAADLIATDKTPLEDITELQRVTFVMRGGNVFRP